MIYRVIWFICRGLFTLFWRYRIRGAHHLPATGPVLVASNHVSYMDPPVVAVGVWRPLRFMAKEELFRGAFARFIRQIGAFPVKRGAVDRAALKQSFDILESGQGLVLFPEGTRGEGGELRAPEMGVGMIAYRAGVPVVPCYVHGTDQAMPRKGGIRLAPISVTYGEPMHFAAPEGARAGRKEYELAAQQIMAAIAALRDAHPVN